MRTTCWNAIQSELFCALAFTHRKHSSTRKRAGKEALPFPSRGPVTACLSKTRGAVPSRDLVHHGVDEPSEPGPPVHHERVARYVACRVVARQEQTGLRDLPALGKPPQRNSRLGLSLRGLWQEPPKPTKAWNLEQPGTIRPCVYKGRVGTEARMLAKDRILVA